jgi:ribosome maturation factor RimP
MTKSNPVDMQALDQLIRPAVEGQGYELVDLLWKREQGGWVLRILIDRQPGMGYISVEDCAAVSREVSALLDVHDLLPGHYNLEVSSPGVERPLKRSADFARFLGQRAKVRLKSTPAGSPKEAGPRRNFVGTIQSVEGNIVRLHTEDAGTVDLDIDEIERANLIYEFGRQGPQARER